MKPSIARYALTAGLGLVLCLRLAASIADADYQAIKDTVAAKAPASATGGAAEFHWRVDQAKRLNDLCEKFLADHPADPRRWEAAVLMIERPRIFVKSFDDALLDQQKPGTVVRGAVVYDSEARVKHSQWLAELDAKAEAATDMAPEFRKKFLLGRIMRKMTAAGVAVTTKKPVDLPALRAAVDKIIADYPDATQAGEAFNRYVTLVKRSGGSPGAVADLLEAYAQSPSAAVREIVQTGLMMRRAQEYPIDWKFTAADGREVDFAKLRGKVVLIDFWATWCHPCVDEIPNVVAAYKKYHAAGFEVVGITLENAGVTPAMNAEQAAAKLAAAKKKMLDFTAKSDMPWPQFFDGTGWKNPYTTKYGIRGIPAMFLLDQEGRVASLDARGALLEKELRRLLTRESRP